MKNNELLELCKEAKKEKEKGKNGLQWEVCLKKVMERKIDGKKSNFLHYKMSVEGNSFNEPVTMLLSIIGIFFPIFMSHKDVVVQGLEYLKFPEIFEDIYLSIHAILSVAFLPYMIFLMIMIIHYMDNLLKYKKIGIVLDEIYKERFEGKESKK